MRIYRESVLLRINVSKSLYDICTLTDKLLALCTNPVIDFGKINR